MRVAVFTLALPLVAALPHAPSQDEAQARSILDRLKRWVFAPGHPNGMNWYWTDDELRRMNGYSGSAPSQQGHDNGIERDNFSSRQSNYDSQPLGDHQGRDGQGYNNQGFDAQGHNDQYNRGHSSPDYNQPQANNRQDDSKNNEVGNQREPNRAPAYNHRFPDDAAYKRFQAAVLDKHNVARSRHVRPGEDGWSQNLTWSEDMAEKARQKADGCRYEHGPEGRDWGQNHAWRSMDDIPKPGEFTEEFADFAIFFANYSFEAFYDKEVDLYDYNTHDLQKGLHEKWERAGRDGSTEPKVAHFTQIVWRETKQVGCAVRVCQPLALAWHLAAYTVCNYAPQGNIKWTGPEGENFLYDKNVLPPTSSSN